MNAIERLTAIEEIRQLKARFFLSVDTKDWDGYAALFTDDAPFEIGGAFAGGGGADAITGLEGASAVRGGKAMAVFIGGLLGDVDTIHIGYMPVIEVLSPGEATAVWPVEDWVWFADPDADPLHGFGRYDERYARTGAGWRIASLRYTRTRLVRPPSAGEVR